MSTAGNSVFTPYQIYGVFQFLFASVRTKLGKSPCTLKNESEIIQI